MFPKDHVPAHLKETYNKDVNDLTEEVLKNLDFLGIDYLIPIGGDDTLSYAVRLIPGRAEGYCHSQNHG